MRQDQRHWPKFIVRLPPDVKAWIAAQAETNSNSMNSEVVRALRERMDRLGHGPATQPTHAAG